MDPQKMKKLMYAAMVSSSVLGYVKKAVVAAITPEPRTCPVCGYRMVEKVRTVPVKAEGDDGKPTIERLGFYQCGGCRERYKAMADGPFTRPSDDEWKVFVLRQRV